MILREALAIAVDTLRGSGTEDAQILQAARELERKLCRLRARTGVRLVSLEWCECGERKRPEHGFCPECYAAFPARLVHRFHTGTLKQMMRARREMKEIANSRLHLAAERQAA